MGTFYVDPNATAGNNSGTSWANAWTSFGSVTALHAGDLCYISGGTTSQTYSVSFYSAVLPTGASGNPITFRAGQDAGHTGTVIFDGTSAPYQAQWLFGAPTQFISWLTFDGGYNGQCNFKVQNYNTVIDIGSNGNGATGIILRYIQAASGRWVMRNCDGIELDHCVIGPQSGIDGNITGIGSGVANYKASSIHHCMIYAVHLPASGTGDDFIQNPLSCWIHHNIFIGQNVSTYSGGQHQDGIQGNLGYCLIDSNYFENVANYCVYGDMLGGGNNTIIINNICHTPDNTITGNGGIICGDNSGPGNMNNIIIANNVVFGGGRGTALGNTQFNNTVTNSQIVNNLVVSTFGADYDNELGQGSGLVMLCNKPDAGANPPNTQHPANNNNPTFVNVGFGINYPQVDFHLASSDTGATANGTNALASTFNYDRDGNPRPAGAWALGPYEPASSSGGSGVTPTVVQHVSSGMERNPLGTLNFTYPMPVKPGNCLVLGIQYNSSGGSKVTSVVSSPTGTWVLGGSASNASFANIALYYLLNATGGITSVTVTMAGLSSQESAMQCVFSEFNNVATTAALDVVLSSSTSLAPGTLNTTSTSGDLVYHWAINGSASNAGGGNYNSSTPIAAGSGFTLLSADLQTGAVVQIATPSAPGAVVPTFTKSGTDTWESVAIALKAAASTQGSPASGFYIGKITHTLISSVAQGHSPSTCLVQYPYSGNLLVALFDAGAEVISSITDSAGNTWSQAVLNLGPGGGGGSISVGSAIWYSQNTNQSSVPSNLITVKITQPALTDCMFTVYDIHGAATAAFDKAITQQGTQTGTNPVGGFNQLTELTVANNFAPTTSNGVAIALDSHDFGSSTGVVGTGYIFDSVWNNLNHNSNSGTPTSTLDEDNARAHIFYTNTSAIPFTFNSNLPTDALQRWSICAAAFKAASVTNVVNATVFIK